MPGQDAPARPGREAPFGALFSSTHTALLAYALRRVVVAEDAADVVAEAYLIAWRRLDEVPEGDEARPWLFGVARRVLSNHRRGEQRRLALADRLRDILSDWDDDHAGSRVDDVERAMSRLRDEDQEVLRLAAWEELARDEIAVALGISRGAVRVRLHRARKRLGEQLGRLSGDDGGPSPVGARTEPASRRPAGTGTPGIEEAR